MDPFQTERYYSFTETKVFTKRLDEIGSLDVLFAIQDDLLRNPARGAVVPGTRGARKARIGDPQKSSEKTGGFRYLYLFLEHKGQIYLLFLYHKGEQTDLTPAQKREIASFVDGIKGARR